MIYTSNNKRPRIHESAYVAPSAILSGDVTVGAGCAVLHGAVLTAEGARIEIGESCVIMENAVLRAAGGEAIRFPLKIGNRCIFGPTAYVVGATIGGGCFIATGAKIFNGAVLEEDCGVALSAVVHIKTRLSKGTRVPIGHIAHGDPASIYPPDRAPEVHERIDFWRDVFNIEPGGDARARAAELYSRFLRKYHAQDAAATPVSSPKRSAPTPSAAQPVVEVEGVDNAMMQELAELEHRRQEALRKQREHK